MNHLSKDTLQALHEAATKGEWASDRDHPHNRMPRVHGGDRSLICEVGNMGTEQDQWEDNAALIAYLCSESTRTEILTLIAEREAMLGALEFWAKRRTTEEVLLGPSEWAEASVERRIEMLGERKRQHDEAVLLARKLTALGGNHHGS